MLAGNGKPAEFLLTDYAFRLSQRLHGPSEATPSDFISAGDLPVRANIEMQAALQPFVDNSISKTIKVPQNTSFDEFKQIYDLAYDMRLKGCTTFRPNPIRGAILSEQAEGTEAPHCRVAEREGD